MQSGQGQPCGRENANPVLEFLSKLIRFGGRSLFGLDGGFGLMAYAMASFNCRRGQLTCGPATEVDLLDTFIGTDRAVIVSGPRTPRSGLPCHADSRVVLRVTASPHYDSKRSQQTRASRAGSLCVRGAGEAPEVTRDRKVVWTYTDDRKGGIHHFQILDARGQPKGKNAFR